MGEFAKVSDELMQEHRLIERVLDALEIATMRLENGRVVRPEFFLEAADFIAGFADGCHHKKEEGVLFGAMIEGGLPRSGEPLDMFLDEHVQGRKLTRGMREAAHKLLGGDASGRPALISNARHYVALLRDHIVKEDEMLFPMADEMFSADEQRRVLHGFARVQRDDVGTDAHASFQALAERLEREASAMAPGAA
jgi:hemerythrin-like domain-containing protein